MELQYFNAAMKGNIDAFGGMGEQIESILTPNKNTILHIHFTNYTDNVSETFVEEVLRMCPKLVLKTNMKDETILHIAARYGHHKIVKKLIECAKGLPQDINEVGPEKRLIRAKNDKEDTALHEAVRYGHEALVDVLIKEEPDHSHFGKNIDDETPLYVAVERRYWKVVDTILDNSSSPPQYNGPRGRTALHAAVLHGGTEIVSKLLTRNSSAAKQADENGWVPLHLAALCASSSQVVELLVSKDRSTAYMKDDKGRTALHLAAFHGDSSIMEKILKYCPDCCELVDEKGNNALHYTTMKERYLYGLDQIMKDTPLISNMCNEKDDDGNTPLHLLARRSRECQSLYHHDLLKPQLSRVDKMAFNKYGQTVLDVAVAYVPQNNSYKNKMLRKLQVIGARLGGRVPDKHLREKKQEQVHSASNTVDEANEKNGIPLKKDYFGGLATTVSVVAILIATVTFTAAFTLPGGLFQDGEHKGSPILKYNEAFMTFVITDSFSFILATFAVVSLYLWSLLNIEQSEFITKMSMTLLNVSVVSTLVALGFMILAFGAGIYAVLGVSKDIGVLTLMIALAFFIIFLIFLMRTLSASIRSFQLDKDQSYYDFLHDPNLERVKDFQLSRML